MIRHLFKLVWNRKRTNGLIILEIFLAFIVVFLVVYPATDLLSKYRRPLGFQYEHVWRLGLTLPVEWGNWGPEHLETVATLHRELEAMDPVLAVAASTNSPYDSSLSVTATEKEGRRIETQIAQATDGLADVLGFELVQGRWFQEGDSALGWTPVVINLALSRETFGTEDPIGQAYLSEGERRVVGVISEFRKGGEFWTPANFMWQRQSLDDPESTPFENLLIRVRPDTTAAFEEEILARLQPMAPGWSIKIQPLTVMRDASHKDHVLPLLGGGIVAGFLLVMVALGLIGVLWQNVTQRTRELGLRRAAGASSKQIHRQILIELSLITTLGVVLGSITVVQLPLLDMMTSAGPGVYAACLVGCAAIIYILALLCGLYPSWLATRIQPAEALHYE